MNNSKLISKFKLVVIILLTVYSIVITFILINRNIKPAKSNPNVKSTIQSNLDNPEDSIPYLPFPVNIFDKNSITSGSSSESGEFDWAVISGEADTITKPTTKISLPPSAYSNQLSDLPPVTPDTEIFKQKDSIEGIPFESLKRELIAKYGDMARRFMIPDKSIVACTAGNELISSISEADVDTDGKNEQIIELYTIGANPWDTRALIVKDSKIIFTAGCGSNFPDIIPSKSGNGFYLEWGDNLKKRIGYIKTRFIWQDGKFIPIFEQSVRYVKVGIEK